MSRERYERWTCEGCAKVVDMPITGNSFSFRPEGWIYVERKHGVTLLCLS